MSQGLSDLQRQALALLLAAERPLDVTEELLPELGLKSTDSTRRSLLRSMRLLEKRGLVTREKVPSDRGGHARVLVAATGAKTQAPARERSREHSKKPTEAGKRLHGLYAKRRVKDTDLINAQIAMQKMVGQLETIDFPECGIGDADPDTVADIYRDLTRLTDWLDKSIPVVAAAMDDLTKRRLIRQLRDTTGRTPEEAKSFQKMADKLEVETLTLNESREQGRDH